MTRFVVVLGFYGIKIRNPLFKSLGEGGYLKIISECRNC